MSRRGPGDGEGSDISAPSERLARLRVTLPDLKESYLSRSIISAAGSAVVLLGFLYLPFAPIIESNTYLWIFTSVLVAISLMCFWYVYLTYRAKNTIESATKDTLDQLNRTIDDQDKIIKEFEEKNKHTLGAGQEKFDRFEDITNDETKIVYGYVHFFPTAVKDGVDLKPKGIGPDFLHEIFNRNLDHSRSTYNWSSIMNALVNGDIDVIATPLYDTRERRELVDFSLPIFYADIGMYCAASAEADDLMKVLDCDLVLDHEGRKCLRFKDLKAQLLAKRKEILGHVNGQYVIRASPGELNSKIAKRHFDNCVRVDLVEESFEIAHALEELVKPQSGVHSHFLFCERAQAEASELFRDKKIINLLAPGELMFPVCFAVRKSDDTLRKFINLRLLEIESAGESGIVKLMTESVSKTTPFDPTMVGKYYPRSQFRI